MSKENRTESRKSNDRNGLKVDPTESEKPNQSFTCVIVTGLPGSGKTTCGKLLSKRLGYRFIDSDKLIERSEGMPVRDIFSSLGEPHFRVLERDLLRLIESRLSGDNRSDYVPTTGIEGSVAVEMLRAIQAKGLVLSRGRRNAGTGGKNRERLKRLGTVVYLFSDPGEIASRLKEDGARPLLSQNAKWNESREPNERNGSSESNDAKVSVQINHKNQTITSANQNISSNDVPDCNVDSKSSDEPDNRSSPSPDNAPTQLLHRLQELLDRRRQAYECADITIDTSGLAPHQIVNRLQEALKTHQQIL